VQLFEANVYLQLYVAYNATQGGIAMLHEQIKRMRERRGISQEELANRLGLTRGRLSMYEIGKREPDVDTLSKMADFFGVSLDVLTDRNEVSKGLKGESLADELPRATPEERDFADWVKDHISQTFFYDFDTAPEERKEQLIADIRYLYERDKKTSRK
jgi:transcriptional regulator with XRE-family HTH domain